MATMLKSTVDQLNSFLRGELSAVETYQQAIAKLPTSTNRPSLEECARSHRTRATLLAREVRRLGGEPTEGSGAWGTFAKLVEGGAQMFGENAAISALEEGEDHGRDDYERDLDGLEPSVRTFIQQYVLPEQLRTHNAMRVLKKS
jgi:demethoxyubiquinone hydroxylase (CLK1/Coq7/Cat5 family)